MMKAKVHFAFKVGGAAVCVEGGTGYGASAGLFDRVGITIRTSGSGEENARVAFTLDVQRGELAAIGFSFLDVARQMAPEQLWARSETVHSGQVQHPQVKPLTRDTSQSLEAWFTEHGRPSRSPLIAFEKMRKRIHILQRMQHQLERCDDATAHKLEQILVTLEHEVSAIPVVVPDCIGATTDG